MYRSIFAILFAVGLLLGCSRSRSDAQIASDIQSKINSDSNIATKEITVGSSNGVVTVLTPSVWDASFSAAVRSNSVATAPAIATALSDACLCKIFLVQEYSIELNR
jgi:hypothetical protein